MSQLSAARRARFSISQGTQPLVIPFLLIVLSLVGLLLGARFGQPGYTFQAGDPDEDRVLVRFHDVERNADGPFRWTEPLSAIYLYGFDGTPAIVSVRLTAPRLEGSAPVLLNTTAAGIPTGEFALGQGWRRYHMVIPTRASGETELRLETPLYQVEGDPRELGVVYSDLRIRSTTDGPPLLFLPRTLFLLVIPLMGWLLLLRLGWKPKFALGLGLLLVLGVSWAAAFPALAGYWLPTLGWPIWPIAPLLILIFYPQLQQAHLQIRRWLNGHPAAIWLGLVTALLGLIGMRLGLSPWIGLPLLFAGVWVGLPPRQAATQIDTLPQDGQGVAGLLARPIFWLGVISAIALFARFYQLDTQPLGLWRDESRHGLQALRIWDDPNYRPIYVVEGADLPALLFYLMAPVLGILGPEVWSVRLVSALAGALTPLALYWAASPLIGRRAALIGAALIAWASWSLSMSRWAFPATLDHLLTLSAIGFAWRGLDRLIGPREENANTAQRPMLQGMLFMGVAGLLAGLATYAYHTGRVAPIALAVVVLIRLGFSWPAWRRALPGILVAAVIGLLTMAPLLLYIANDYEGYNRRVGRVSIFNTNYLNTHTPLGVVLQNTERYLEMWHVRGEPNGRHHMPHAPMLDPLAGMLFLLGIALTLRKPYLPARFVMLGVPLVYMVPALFSSDAPHAMRALGMLAPACMLAGFGFDHLLRALRTPRWQPFLAILVLSLGFNLWLYFGVMRVEPNVYGEFDVTETLMGRVAREPFISQNPEQQAVHVYLTEEFNTTDTVEFLTYGRETYVFDSTANPLPDTGPALILLSSYATEEEQAAARAALGPDVYQISDVPHFPNSERPIVIGFARGAAAQELFAQAANPMR